MKKRSIIAALLCLCLLTGCAPFWGPMPDGIIDIGTDALPCSEEELYRQLFDPASRVEISIDMSEEELSKLQDDYKACKKSPIYRPADMTVTITSDGRTTTYRIEDVGVRMKGNTSRTDFYDPQQGIYNAIHLKISFRETFDEPQYYGSDCYVWEKEGQRDVRRGRTFATLEKLEMRWNKCYDSTYIKESYAYELFRAYGVMAPRVSLCSLDWSGLHMGVYTVAEPVDQVFLAKRLPKKALGGDLYKLGWSNTGATFTRTDSIGIEDELKNRFYTYDLKTNKKTSNHEALKNLIAGLNDPAITKESFAELVDAENFLHFAAVTFLLGNPDDLRNNYNNGYVYFRENDGKAMFIPYDYDRCLGVTYEWDPYGDGMTREDPFSNLQTSGRQINPLFLRSVVAGGFYVSQFAEILQQVAGDRLLQPETFAARFAQAQARYGADAQPGRKFSNGRNRDWRFSLEGEQNIPFAHYIAAKKDALTRYITDLQLGSLAPKPTHYIRGDFCGWEKLSRWSMDAEEGLLTFTLAFAHSFRFKVYEAATDHWYGVESLAPDTPRIYSVDADGNICLQPGLYFVTFDPESKTVAVLQNP